MSPALRLVLVALCCCITALFVSCSDPADDEFKSDVADALEETLRQVLDPTPTAGPNPVLDPWAELVCKAIAMVTPNLEATILADDPQLSLVERKRRLELIREVSGTELRGLLRDLRAVSPPFPARSIHEEAIGMYERALTVLHESAVQWRDVQTSEELDVAVLQLSRDVETAYFRFSFSTNDEDPAVFGAIGRAGCDFQDPLGEFFIVGPVDVPIR